MTKPHVPLHDTIRRHRRQLLSIAIATLLIAPTAVPAARQAPTSIYYAPNADGFLIDFLAITGLKYGFAYIGDSMNTDVFANLGGETSLRPAEGDTVQDRRWRRFNAELWANNSNVKNLRALRSPEYRITALFAYVWSDRDHPDARFLASSDDGLKVVLNGEVLWRNQIQRSPTIDSDRMDAPLRQGWNDLLCVIDRVRGGHLFVGRFVDGEGTPITDLKIVLAPPDDREAIPTFMLAETYNSAAAALLREAHTLRAAGEFEQAIVKFGRMLDEFPYAEASPRALAAKAEAQYDEVAPSLNVPAAAADTLRLLWQHYPAHPVTEYAVIRLAAIEAGPLSQPDQAMDTYGRFVDAYPQSALVPTALLEWGKLQLEAAPAAAIATLRRIVTEHPGAEELVEAFVAIGDARRAEGDSAAAERQYRSALDIIEDWIGDRFATDVGKQAWLRDLESRIHARLRD